MLPYEAFHRNWPAVGELVLFSRGRRAIFRLDMPPPSGYTFSMKTAVSIPDDVFEDAERLAGRLKTSRSQLYARALSEFVARHDDDHLTASMNRVVDEVGTQVDDFTHEAARQALGQVEW